MAIETFISVKGSRQGQFKGETLTAGREDKWMTVLSVDMDLQVPSDPATGQASGRRQYSPVKIIKPWGAASPQGLSACATNENLPEVRIEFVKATTAGVEEVYQSISLTDASFSGVRRFTSGDIAQPANTVEVEEWSFTFRKIEVKDNDGRTDFTDSWS